MARPSSRETFIDYCLRRLGHPVIEINMDEEQMDDRVDDALQLYYEYHADGSTRIPFAIKLTQTHFDNEYIDLNAVDSENPGLAALRNRIINVGKVFPLNDQTSDVNFFDVKYQMRLNDMFDLQTGIGDLAYYEQMQQYLGLVDMKLTGHPQIAYNRRTGHLVIEGDLKSEQTSADIRVGEFIMAELYIRLGNDVNVWDDLFLKEYTTALFKKQWGENISKFDGITMPGGITLNGRQLVDDANVDIEKARERLYNEYDTPPDFFVG